MRRIAITLAVVAMAVASLAASGVLAAPSATAPTATKAAITVNVTAVDFKFRLSRLSVPKGSVVTFKVINRGNTAHDFDFPSKGTPYLARGKTAKFTITFRKAGSFRFVCTVPRHVQFGMAGFFKVR